MPIIIKEENIPKIPHHCLVRLQAIYDLLKSAEKKAADLLIDDPEFFGTASIIEAAGRAGCSEATLVRLARRMGYSGYPELKSVLTKDKDDSPIQLYSDISCEDDYDSVVSKVFRASIQAMEDTLNILDKGEYRKAVDELCTAKNIMFCGAGDAAAVARSGYQKFLRAGLNVQASTDIDVQLIAVSHLEEGDVLIAISHSGRTKSVVDVAKYAKSIGVTVICITNYPVSPLTKNSDIVLLTANFAQHMNGEVMSKRITELCILESLYINVLLKKKNEMVRNINMSNMALEINKI